MRIWLTQTGEIIPFSKNDRVLRSAQLAFELASRGHEVIWWASAFEHQRKKWVDNNGQTVQLAENLKIILLKGIGYKQNVSIKRFVDHLIVANKFTKLAKSYPKPDIIINSLPEHNLAYHTQKYAKKNNIPTFVDLRDYWPDFMLQFFQNKFLKSIVRLILTRDFYRSRYVLKNANVLVSMMQTMFDWGLEKGKRKPNNFDQVFYIGSPKQPNHINKEFSEEFKTLLKNSANKFNILYIGTFTDVHDPTIILETANIINKNTNFGSKINFILAGDGILQKKIKKMANGTSNIFFPGWVDKNEISALLNISKIGFIPINSDEEFFPNKAFLYFSGGLPVFSSSKGEISELINKYNLGYNIDLQKPEQIVDKIENCIDNPGMLKKMGKNIDKIFTEQFDSDIIYKNYADLIEKYISKKM
ncbi:MAG: hypothetical protein B6I20_02540 [Bacteroidetes bacterium 4572_117]|nr:MAG: hypothetical protein B6I20_02540 [Bacteroidetes bacterium 4572_117]